MHLAQLRSPLQRVVARGCQPSPTALPWTCLTARLAAWRIDGASAAEGRRYASVKSQGAYRIPNKKTKPKKMGAKKTGDQYVIPGNIIYKQRGTIWHAGENTILGRDHTIHAAVAGYVKYYRDPARHPKRQYIGVTFERDDTLPYPPTAPRKRRLGLVAVTRKAPPPEPPLMTPSGLPRYIIREEDPADRAAARKAKEEAEARDALRGLGKTKPKFPIRPSLRKEYKAIRATQGVRVLRLQDDYSYRETNWEIGRLVGPAGKVQGTEQLVARRTKLRSWRGKRAYEFRKLKVAAAEKKERRHQHQARERKRADIKAAERAQLLAEDAARKRQTVTDAPKE